MKTLFNDGWRFKRMEIGASLDEARNQDGWRNVEIPHDWLIYDTAGLYDTGEGWYVKRFHQAEGPGADVLSLIFDGVYMDATVFVNGTPAWEWKYGYTAFCVEITPFLRIGENELMVRARYEAPNSRWYSGAGIYRNVWLLRQKHTRILNDGVYIHPYKSGGHWAMRIETEIAGNADGVRHTLLDRDGRPVQILTGHAIIEETIKTPTLWDTENPYLYTLQTELLLDGEAVDEVIHSVGFRTVEFSPQNGFFLNGRSLKMHGVCLHHDMGALGAAFNSSAARRQLELMKGMGVNAVRISHNPHAREFLDLCDSMGLLVIDEAFDMWELPKNQNDYARFFPEWHTKDTASWIRRDRNHPCVILWSIGNEIYDTHKDARGLETANALCREVRKHDPHQNATITIASNYMPFENAQNVADTIKIAGYNYAENLYDRHHEEHPDWFIYGSETASAVRSRGVYHFPMEAPVLTHPDLQCSDLGNSVVGWGAAAEKAWIDDRDKPYCGGQFVWTGMDYIGEPTPYPTKNSYFGAVDTAGLPKAVYYLYKAVWDRHALPFIKLFPHWDWNAGQLIDVIAYSNISVAELFLNGRSLGRQTLNLETGIRLHFEWQVPYEPGELSISAYGPKGDILASDSKKSCGEPSKIHLETSGKPLYANCTDLKYIHVSVLDECGIPVENARNRIFVKTNGAARLAGIDSGDSTDYDSYKGHSKRLFGGQLTVILQAGANPGEAVVEFTAQNLTSARARFDVLACAMPEGTAEPVEYIEPREPADEIPLRKIELAADRLHLDECCPTARIAVSLRPENADDTEIEWKCVLSSGAETDLASLAVYDGGADVTAKGDGCFKVRVISRNGTDHPQIISELDFTASGLGEAVKDPFRFILASRYDISRTPLKVIEKGAVAGVNKARTVVGFRNLDFGQVKTRSLRLYLGTTSYFDEVPVEVWVGDPDEPGSRQMGLLRFPRNNLHYDFLPYDFTLSEPLAGRMDICFVFERRCVFGGFEFLNRRVFETLYADERDEIYGDQFTLRGRAVENIGNNVILSFRHLDFGETGTSKIRICGHTPAGNTLSMRVKRGDDEETMLLEFDRTDAYTEQDFSLPTIRGRADLHFVFLPGSNFNFEWFQFIEG